MNRLVGKRAKRVVAAFLSSFLFLYASIGIAQSQHAMFRHLTAKEGFTSATVWCIFKDSKGFIWLGAFDGLYRYDGYQFKSYKNDPADPSSISSNSIYAIFEDKDGILWFGSGWYGLNKYNRASDNFKRYYPNPDTSTFATNGIICIYQDKSGTLWVSTPTGGLHQYIDSTDSFNTYQYDTINPANYRNFIICMLEDSKGNFLVGTWAGLYIFDREEKTYHDPEFLKMVDGIYRFNYDNEYISFNDLFGTKDDFRTYSYRKIIENPTGIYWFASVGGLLMFDANQNRLTIFEHQPGDPNSLSDLSIQNIVTNPLDGHQTIWISTAWGLNRFNIEAGTNKQYHHDPSNPNSLAYSLIINMYLDDDGLLWIGNENSGVSILNLLNTHYEYYQINPTPEEDQLHTATSFCKDRHGNTWVGTEKGGLFKYDQEMNLIDHYTFYLPDIYNQWCNFIYSIYESNNGHLWAGTVNNGLFLYDQANNEFRHCKLIRGGSALQYERINVVFKDSHDWYWVGASIGTGLFYQTPETEKITEFHQIIQPPLEHIDIRDFYEDENGTLWIATNGEGLFLLPPENRDSLLFERFIPDADIGNVLGNTMAIFRDHQGDLWFGGNHGLTCYSPLDRSFKNFNSRNGLETDLIYDIEGDHQYLWLSSDKGLIRFNPTASQNKMVKIMRFSDGVPFEDIYTYNIYKCRDGKIHVGGKRGSGKGFYRFHPDNIKENQKVPPLAFTSFQVSNKPFPLDSSITEKKHLMLRYNQNYFSFEFAALDYVDTERNQYAYKLEGVDEEWVQSGNRRFVNYTGISPGSYIFKVRGSNNDGLWNEQGISMAIIILPPPWKTWWAYIIYGIALSAMLYALRQYDLKRQRLKQNLELEKVEKDKLGELDRMKSRFFANISHEFRTPLTLILGPLRNLKKETSSKSSQEDMNIIQRNALRLKQLINQLLSLSKLESGKMKLQAQELDIVQLVKGYNQSFESLAKQKGIKLKFESEKDEIMLWADQDKIEKILYNLLSNAFKFTGEGGSIKVRIAGYKIQDSDHWSLVTGHELQNSVVISVSDTGSGIAEDRLPHIFDRFYQADDTYKADQEGTGIGLALTKELVELHHGEIKVKSEAGSGSCFGVYLPIGDKHLTDGEKLENKSTIKNTEYRIDNIEKLTTENRQLKIENSIKSDPDKPILLIVEDNTDLRIYIRGQLEDEYNILEAKDGEQGFSRAIENIPDLVLSDVMMPKMDGFELCKKLKTDERTSHIPVILLTARASMESKIEGLETGADDFITKPFDPQELQVRIRNLIIQRQRLRETLVKDLGKPGFPSFISSVSGIATTDQQFLQKATKVVEEHLSDTEFNVELFGREMALSRVQLHRKLRALIDHSASEFIRGIRLNKAAQMLLEKKGNVTQIAYEVGFNNLSYFAKCFQQMYGESPSAFASTNPHTPD